ncbi:MAG TPA: hypothetical protein VKW06_15915 [Candidatus Angelobacter sp.]|nr:hypothetical protein [Candidatus Angelobacter sp.]
MKIRTSLVHLTTITFLLAARAVAQVEAPPARIVTLALDAQSVTLLHLRPGFISSVRLPEEVSSVVLGDPVAFKGEHSEAEPRLVFFKPTIARPARTNALITTRTGREVSLTLVSEGSMAHGEPVDYVLEYQSQRSFLVESARSSFVIGETRKIAEDSRKGAAGASEADAMLESSKGAVSDVIAWQGRDLRVGVRGIEEKGQEVTVVFAVVNASPRTIELLPPQVQLAGPSSHNHPKKIKAEPVAIKDYRLASRRLPSGASIDGVVVFERPPFKEGRERLLLQVAQVEEVDRPVFAPIAFVAPVKGGGK